MKGSRLFSVFTRGTVVHIDFSTWMYTITSGDQFIPMILGENQVVN